MGIISKYNEANKKTQTTNLDKSNLVNSNSRFHIRSIELKGSKYGEFWLLNVRVVSPNVLVGTISLPANTSKARDGLMNEIVTWMEDNDSSYRDATLRSVDTGQTSPFYFLEDWKPEENDDKHTEDEPF